MGCGAELPKEPTSVGVERQALTCGAGCGAALGSANLPTPGGGTVSLTAWSNSPQLGTSNDCDPTNCAGASPNTAQNGQASYGCPWQCVELTNRYLQGTWGGHKISANAGTSYCSFAASSSLPEYYVYGTNGAGTSGHAPIAGDVLVWSSHVAIATNSVAPGASGTVSVIEENATCSGTDTVSWNGSMFGNKYGLTAECWVHVVANSGASATCPSGSNWNGAGDYCANEPGMAGTAASTLYSCGAAGGPAAVLENCSAGCQDMPAGLNDQCATGGPTCPTGSNWNGAGDYCWDQPGLTSGATDTLYSCAAAGGSAASVKVCAAGCQHMPKGQNDQCYALYANGAACARSPECSSGNCVAGVCCATACGACGACASGTCTPVGAGGAGSQACNPYVCDGTAINCPTGCADDSSCAALDYCDAGFCVPTLVDGASCSASDQCQSTSCVGATCVPLAADGGTAQDAGNGGADAGRGADAGLGGKDGGPGGADAGGAGPAADGGAPLNGLSGCGCGTGSSPGGLDPFAWVFLVATAGRRPRR